MQEYKITGDELNRLNDLLRDGFEIEEINSYMGYAEIKLSRCEDRIEKLTIIMEAI